MKDSSCQEFQRKVSQFLIRHQSILDLLTKAQESNARLNRAVVKAVTNCGCIQVQAEKKSIPPEASLSDLKNLLDSHIRGELCPNCREVIESEMGKNLFYLTALCSTLDIELSQVLEQERQKITTLGIFNLT